MSSVRGSVDVSPWGDDDAVNVIIDTPKGSRNKYKFDERRAIFTLGGILPVGAFSREENHRLIGVAAESWTHREVMSLDDVTARLVEEIEHFFVSYNAAKHKKFTPRGRFGPDRARAVVEKGITARRTSRSGRRG